MASDNVISTSFLVDIQRGVVPGASFYGDMSVSNLFSQFQSGVDSATNYEGFASIDLGTLPAKTRNEVIRRANSMSAYGNISFDCAVQFILILVNVSKSEDMNKIAIAVDIPELVDVELGDVEAILNVPNFDKVAYLASAVNSVIAMFSKYGQASGYAKASQSNNPLDLLSSMLSGFGGGSSIKRMIDTSATEDKVGHFLSELLTGERIPSTIIACNPMKESPSYTGKVFFGEGSAPISLVDMNEIFNRKIGSYGNPMNGAGTSSFNFSNLGSLQGSQNLTGMIKQFAFGAGNPSTAKLNEVVEKATSIMGANANSSIELNRADNAIPFMIGMSAINTGMDKSPFSTTTFSEGWKLAQSVNSFLASNQNDLLTVMRKLG